MVENVAQNVAAEHVNAVNVQNVEVNLASAKNNRLFAQLGILKRRARGEPVEPSPKGRRA
ncbi:MAG: hypothetical protein V1646_00040 [bacterium]